MENVFVKIKKSHPIFRMANILFRSPPSGD